MDEWRAGETGYWEFETGARLPVEVLEDYGDEVRAKEAGADDDEMQFIHLIPKPRLHRFE